MPRLLILCEYPTLLGGERSMLSTLCAIQSAGYEVHVAAPPVGPLADAVRDKGLQVVAWDARADLPQVIERVGPDLVHANSLSTSRISGPVVAASGVPSVGHLRDIVKLSQQAVADVNFHHCLVAVSQATREFHTAQGIDAAKCVVVNNGVDLEEFQPRPASGYLHRELRLPHGVQFVAIIGQIGMRKATDVAISAARLCAESLPGVHWLIIGERTSDKVESFAFEQLVHKLAGVASVTARVHLLGTRTDVPALLNECTVLVHAARQEPLGRVLLEAAASGVAIVATDVGGTEEIFPPGSDAAVLVRPNDAEAIADAVTDVMGNERRRAALQCAARARAEEAFDVRVAAIKLIELYRRVLSL